MNLQQLRAETPGCQFKIHLNNAGASFMPQPAVEAIRSYLELENTTGGYELAHQKADELKGIYQALAQYLHCTAEEIAITSSATDSYARALSAIPFRAGDLILTTESDYASNHIAFLSLQKRFDIKIMRIANDASGQLDLAAFAKAIENHHPKLVAVTHVPTNSGIIQPVEIVGQYCRQHDILYLVDACQSAGQLPLDVQAIGCDFLTATFRKFMRGPRGMGFLYVSKRVLENGLEPLFIDMRGADWVGAAHYLPKAGAGRFEYWEFPYALVMGAKVAVEYMLHIGIENIAKRNEELCRHLRGKLSEIAGIRLLDEGTRLCSIITLVHDQYTSEELQNKLSALNINTSVSGRSGALIDFDKKGVHSALRLSPHYFNTIEELDAMVVALS